MGSDASIKTRGLITFALESIRADRVLRADCGGRRIVGKRTHTFSVDFRARFDEVASALHCHVVPDDPGIVAGIHAFFAGEFSKEGANGPDNPGDAGEEVPHDRNVL